MSSIYCLIIYRTAGSSSFYTRTEIDLLIVRWIDVRVELGVAPVDRDTQHCHSMASVRHDTSMLGTEPTYDGLSTRKDRTEPLNQSFNRLIEICRPVWRALRTHLIAGRSTSSPVGLLPPFCPLCVTSAVSNLRRVPLQSSHSFGSLALCRMDRTL